MTDKILTPFRLLDKDVQRNFKKTWGAKLTGLQFNKFFSRMVDFINHSPENMIKLENHDTNNYAFRNMIETIAYRVKGYRYTYEEASAEFAPIIDLLLCAYRRQAKENKKAEIKATGAGLLSLADLKKRFWMVDFDMHKTKMCVHLCSRIDFEAKKSSFRLNFGVWYPRTKNDYYNPNAFMKFIEESLIAPRKEMLQKNIEEANKISQVMAEEAETADFDLL